MKWRGHCVQAPLKEAALRLAEGGIKFVVVAGQLIDIGLTD
ncbi:hypothetical protein [Paraburkholderia xenovorans]